ncbi:Cell wall protein SED1 [Verticillium dahliae VDG1]|nr:hypothetical protein VdG2_06239 [Verticillium dahliae VDG2]KAF3356173.1 Cell wall protein SED1 [Verticillium dahliae VDG1]
MAAIQFGSRCACGVRPQSAPMTCDIGVQQKGFSLWLPISTLQAKPSWYLRWSGERQEEQPGDLGNVIKARGNDPPGLPRPFSSFVILASIRSLVT